MADTSFTDTSATAPGTSVVAAWLNAVDKFVYWGRNPVFATTTGTANDQILTLPSPSLYSAYGSGDTFLWRAGFTNAGNMTLQVVGASTLAQVRVRLADATTTLSSGMVIIGGIYITAYQATVNSFLLLSMPAFIAPESLPPQAIVLE